MPIPHKTFLWLLAALLLSGTCLAFIFWSFEQIEEASNRRLHSRQVLVLTDKFLLAMKDAELGERGYALTGDAVFLAPYRLAVLAAKGHFAQLRTMDLQRTAQQELEAIGPLLTAEFTELDRVVEIRRTGSVQAAAAQVQRGEAQRLMIAIDGHADRFNAIQAQAQLTFEADFALNMRRLFGAIAALGTLALLFALNFARSVYRDAHHRIKQAVHQETQDLLASQQRLNVQLQSANAALRVSQERLAVTLNSIGDAVIATDANARITLLNPVAETLTGWDKAQAMGQPIEAVFHIIAKHSRAPATIPVGDALAKGVVQGLANHTVLIARDGQEFDIADSCAPIRDADNSIIGAVLVFRNVTTEYEAHQAVQDSTALVRSIFKTVADGIVTFHAQSGAIESCNPAVEALFGYQCAELIDKSFAVLVPELDHIHPAMELAYFGASTFDQTQGLRREVMGLRKDGSQLALELSVNETFLRGERYFTALLRDVATLKAAEADRTYLSLALKTKNTELEQARNQADRANLAKSDFLSSMSHELRTPLGAILGFAQLLESGSPPPTSIQKRSVDQILKAGWYLLELINEILDLALIESGKICLSMEPVSLSTVLSECQMMVEPQAQKGSIQLVFNPCNAQQFVQADRTRLKQILINLLSNAIKYNRPQGKVTVECNVSESGWVRVSVRDTGAGLAPEQLAQLFQPFNRLGRDINGEEGTGIGLVVSKRLVELMGGQIGYASTVGEGSVFWFQLAAVPAPQLPALAANPPGDANPLHQGQQPLRTLLYVEDNPANLMLVEDILLRRPDVRLLTASDGISGIAMARTHLPDLVLMDINLPGISGLGAMRVLASDPRTAHIPVIALSANAMPRDIEKGLDAGFLRYLTKPIKIDAFMEALDLAFSAAATAPPPHE